MSTGSARLSVRRPVSRDGSVDAAWWPHSLDLVAELAPLLAGLGEDGRTITRVSYHLGAWDAAPRRAAVSGRVLRLGGYATGSAHTVQLQDAWGVQRIDVLVLAPDTEPATARRAMAIAAEAGNPRSVEQIMADAGST